MAKVTVTGDPVPETLDPIPLPTWTDPVSVVTYVTTLGGIVLGVIEAVDPTGGAAISQTTGWVLPLVGFAIAGIAQIVNVTRHTVLHKAAIAVQGARLPTPTVKVVP